MESFKLDLSNFIFQEKIGEGIQSRCFLALEKETKQKCAVLISCFTSSRISLIFDRILAQIKILTKISCPITPKFIDYNINISSKYIHKIIITEFIPNDTLFHIISMTRTNYINSEWTETKKFINIYGIVFGMSYLHSINIIHRDLTTKSILLDEYLYPKIINFGSSLYLENNDKTEITDISDSDEETEKKIENDHKIGKKSTNERFIEKDENNENSIEKDENNEKFFENNEKFLEENLFDDMKIIHIDDNKENLIGTPSYIAPEVYETLNYSKSSDVFSFSIILYEILTNQNPFKFESNHQIAKFVTEGGRPEINDKGIPECYIELLTKCWNPEPSERPTFDEILTDLITNKKYVTELNVDEEEFENYRKLIEEKIEPKIEKIQIVKEEKKIEDLSIEIEEIDLSKYKLDKLIKQDTFSNVYKIIEKETNNIYEAKISHKTIDEYSSVEMNAIKREITILSKIKFPSIIKFIGYNQRNFSNYFRPTIITEFVKYQSLENNINKLNETAKLIIIYGIASGMSYLHSLNIIHRDLKPSNIFLDENLFPKICNFKFSREINENENEEDEENENISSILFMAPEILTENKYSKASDVYSFSLVVYFILTFKKPYKEFKYIDIINEVPEGIRPGFSSQNIPTCYKELIEKCWSNDLNKRPTFDEIIQTIKTNPGFITDDVDKDEFLNYIKYIDDERSQIEHDEESGKNTIDDEKTDIESFEEEEEEASDDIKEEIENDIKNDKEETSKEEIDKEEIDKEKIDKEKTVKEEIEEEETDNEETEKEEIDKEKIDKEETNNEETNKEIIDKEKTDKEEIVEEETDNEETDKEVVDKDKTDKEETVKEKNDKEETKKEEIDKGKTCKEEIDKEKTDKEETKKEETDEEETKKEEIDKEETKKEDIKKEEIDKEKTKKEETDKEEIKKEETDKEETKKEEIDKEKTGKEEIDIQEADKEETKKEETDKEETKKEETDKEDIKKEETKKEETKKEETDKEDIKKEETKKEETDEEETDKEETDKEETNNEKVDINEEEVVNKKAVGRKKVINKTKKKKKIESPKNYIEIEDNNSNYVEQIKKLNESAGHEDQVFKISFKFNTSNLFKVENSSDNDTEDKNENNNEAYNNNELHKKEEKIINSLKSKRPVKKRKKARRIRRKLKNDQNEIEQNKNITNDLEDKEEEEDDILRDEMFMLEIEEKCREAIEEDEKRKEEEKIQKERIKKEGEERLKKEKEEKIKKEEEEKLKKEKEEEERLKKEKEEKIRKEEEEKLKKEKEEKIRKEEEERLKKEKEEKIRKEREERLRKEKEEIRKEREERLKKEKEEKIKKEREEKLKKEKEEKLRKEEEFNKHKDDENYVTIFSKYKDVEDVVIMQLDTPKNDSPISPPNNNEIKMKPKTTFQAESQLIQSPRRQKETFSDSNKKIQTNNNSEHQTTIKKPIKLTVTLKDIGMEKFDTKSQENQQQKQKQKENEKDSQTKLYQISQETGSELPKLNHYNKYSNTNQNSANSQLSAENKLPKLIRNNNPASSMQNDQIQFNSNSPNKLNYRSPRRNKEGSSNYDPSIFYSHPSNFDINQNKTAVTHHDDIVKKPIKLKITLKDIGMESFDSTESKTQKSQGCEKTEDQNDGERPKSRRYQRQ